MEGEEEIQKDESNSQVRENSIQNESDTEREEGDFKEENDNEEEEEDDNDEDEEDEEKNEKKYIREYVDQSNILEGKRKRTSSNKAAIEEQIFISSDAYGEGSRKKKGKNKKGWSKISGEKKDGMKKRGKKIQKGKECKKFGNEGGLNSCNPFSSKQKEKQRQSKSQCKEIFDHTRGVYKHPNPNLIHLTVFNRIFELHHEEMKAIKNGKIKATKYLRDLKPEEKRKSQTLIRGDLKTFDFYPLIKKFRSFDGIFILPQQIIHFIQLFQVIMMSPRDPEDILTEQELINLPVEKLSDHGFLFFWIDNLSLNEGYSIASKWGYDVIDQIVWVELDTPTGKTKNSESLSTPLLNCHQMCLIGVKKRFAYCGVEHSSKVSNNMVVAARQKEISTVDWIYDLIDLFKPGSMKIELFAKKSPMRNGWIGVQHENLKTIIKNKYSSQKPINIEEMKHSEDSKQVIDTIDYIPTEEGDKSNNNLNSCQKTESRLEEEEEEVKNNPFSFQLASEEGEAISCQQSQIEQKQEPNLSQKKVPLPIFYKPAKIVSRIPCFKCKKFPLIGINFTSFSGNQKSSQLCNECFFNSSSLEISQLNSKLHTASFTSSDQTQRPKMRCGNMNCNKGEDELFMNQCAECFGLLLCEKCRLTQDSIRLPNNLTHCHQTYHTFLKIQN